jgi:hypothetical protein
VTFAECIPHLLAGKVVKRAEHTSGQIAYGWAFAGNPLALRMVRYFKDATIEDEPLSLEDASADDWEVTDWGER